jgi:DNA uptake protein ComE-like DNA-binding protein
MMMFAPTLKRHTTMRAATARRAAAHRGSVVVVVVWAVAVAAVLVSATQIVTFRQAVVGRETLARVQARWAARAGMEQMVAIMEFHLQNADPDDPMAVVRDMEEHATGTTATGSWDIRHFLDGLEWAGPLDEGAKLNINVATSVQLTNIPNMTPDVVDAIIDWRDADDNVQGLGAESDYYANRSLGYKPRNGNFRSFAELELVAGAWPQYVRGEDWNLNGRLDANENDGNKSFPNDKPDGKLDGGWSKFLTATSVQSPMSLSGEDKLPLKGADPESLTKRLGIDADQAKALATYGNQPNAKPEALIATPLSQLASGGTGGTGGTGGGSSGSTGGKSGGTGASGGRSSGASSASTSMSASTGGSSSGGMSSSGGKQSSGGAGRGSTGSGGSGGSGSPSAAGGGSSGRSSSGRSSGGTGGASAVADLTNAQLRAVLRETTADDFTKPVPGRMNINTVPDSVLKEVMEIDPRLADAIIARRRAKPEGITSLADLSDMSGINPTVLTQLATQFDVTSSVYTVTSRGRAATTGAEVEIEAVVDKSQLPAKIISYREQ